MARSVLGGKLYFQATAVVGGSRSGTVLRLHQLRSRGEGDDIVWKEFICLLSASVQ